VSEQSNLLYLHSPLWLFIFPLGWRGALLLILLLLLLLLLLQPDLIDPLLTRGLRVRESIIIVKR